MKKVVIKLSGKFVSPLDSPLVKEYAQVLDRLHEDNYKVVVVVGGGSVARKYIQEAPPSKALQDFVGIEASRLNALLLSLHMKHAIKKVPRSVNEIVELLSYDKVVVMGGLQPGQSTNAVSLIVAELIDADIVINATTVDAVYDKPPWMEGAKRLERVSYDELIELLEKGSWSQEPGRYELFDYLSLQIAKRSSIPIAVVYGGNAENVLKAVKESVYGTLVSD